MSKLALMLAAGAVGACSSAPSQDTSQEADLVYAALLNERHEHLEAQFVIVNAETIDGLAPVVFEKHDPDDRLDYIRQELPEVSRGTLNDYKTINSAKRRLDSIPGFTVPHRIRLVTDDDQDRVSVHHAAESASIDRPTGIVTLSRVGFDPSRTQAVLYAEFYCGPECGHGEYVMLTRVDGQWRIADSATLFAA